MKIYDPFLFLIGSKASIKRIAGSYWSLLVGLILVLSAGVARNYDHIDFQNSWEWVLGPITASLVSCVIVYVLGMRRVWRHPASRLSFLSFLSVYWMTAPCAWIYGIPVESFTDIITATKWNIAFLAIVSIWRVALMVRCLIVLTEMKFIWAFLSILLPASLVSFVASFFKGISLVGIMGGVRLPPETLLLQSAAKVTLQYSFFLLFILLLVKLALYQGQPSNYAKPLPWQKAPKFPLYAVILCSLIFGGSFFFTGDFQSKVKNNKELQRLLVSEDNMEAAFHFLNDKKADDFSLIHDFPPSRGYHHRNNLVRLKKIMDQPASSVPAWAREIWHHDYTEAYIQSSINMPDAFSVQSEGAEVIILLDRNKLPKNIKITVGDDDSEMTIEKASGQKFLLKLDGEKVTKISEVKEGVTTEPWPRDY